MASAPTSSTSEATTNISAQATVSKFSLAVNAWTIKSDIWIWNIFSTGRESFWDGGHMSTVAAVGIDVLLCMKTYSISLLSAER
jgi:hypothetical protein